MIPLRLIGNKKLRDYGNYGMDKIAHLFPKPNVIVKTDREKNNNSDISDNENGTDGNRYSSRRRDQKDDTESLGQKCILFR